LIVLLSNCSVGKFREINLIVELISSTIEALKSSAWLLTGIAIPLFSALFGAWFGASVAAKLAEKSSKKQQLVSRISETQAAILECDIAFKDFISLKRQLVRPAYEKFVSDRNRIVSILGIPTMKKEIEADLDLKVFHNSPQNIERLAIRMADLGVPPKALLHIRAAATASATLAVLNIERNAWIEDVRTKNITHKESILMYFGIPSAHTFDTRYKDIIEGISNACDDCIFHLNEVVDHLFNNNLSLRRSFFRGFGPRYRKCRELPQLTKFELSDEMRGELPDIKKYSDWIRPSVKKKKKWWWSNIRHEKVFAIAKE